MKVKKNFIPGYDLINRAIYYSARLLSRQKTKIWSHSEYDKLMKVVSLWICYDPSKSYKSKLLRIHLNCDIEVGTLDVDKDILDKIEIIMVFIGEDAREQENKILSFLEDLLSNRLNAQEKMKMFKDEYDIEDKILNERVMGMCNLSAGYFEAGEKHGIELGYKESTLQHIQSLKEKLQISDEQAMDILDIPENERSLYK